MAPEQEFQPTERRRSRTYLPSDGLRRLTGFADQTPGLRPMLIPKDSTDSDDDIRRNRFAAITIGDASCQPNAREHP
jgi:hypothetical protein